MSEFAVSEVPGLPRSIRWCVALSILALFVAGCGDGCGTDVDDGEAAEDVDVTEVSEPLREQVVAAGRISNFADSEATLGQWAETAGLIDEAMTPEAQATAMPTGEVRYFLEDLLGDTAEQIQWDGPVDIALWEPEVEGASWRWALRLPQAADGDFQVGDDWGEEGNYRIAGGEAEPVPVYLRPGDDDSEQAYYLSEIDSSKGADGGRAVTISNFAAGAARIGEAVSMAELAGDRDAELTVWPKRWGVADRYQRAAVASDERIATNIHNMPPARVALFQLQAQVYRALGDPDAWPEQVRLTVETEHDGEVASQATVEIDFSADQGTLIPALWSALGDGELGAGPQVVDAVGQLGFSLQPGELASFVEAVLPPHWLRLLSVRGTDTQQRWIEEFEQMLPHHGGPTTVAFYPSAVPMGLTAEMFVGWRDLNGDDVIDDARRFHRSLMKDFWMPLFGAEEFATDGESEADLGGESVTLHEQTFALSHGYGGAGVCWTVRGEEYLSFYGVNPCDRLQEVADFPEEEEAGPALAYEGSLQSLMKKLYILPGDSGRNIFGDLQIAVDVERDPEQRFTLSATVDDPTDMVQIIDRIPRLAEHWAPETTFGDEAVTSELGLDAETFQEPGLMAVGAPGVGGILPVSFLLGMPFSFPPTPPTGYRQIYFADPETRGSGHIGHGHSH